MCWSRYLSQSKVCGVCFCFSNTFFVNECEKCRFIAKKSFWAGCNLFQKPALVTLKVDC